MNPVKAAKQEVDRLISLETDGALAPDCRRVLRDERLQLQATIRTCDSRAMIDRTSEAQRVRKLWGC